MIQTILVPKVFGLIKAMNWIISHGYSIHKIDDTEHYYRFRQQEPNHNKHYYSKKLPNGIILINYS